jgi:hypothetical protein
LQEREEHYRERIAGVSERVVGHIEAMCLDEILTRSAQFEKIETIPCRTFGLNDAPSSQGCLSEKPSGSTRATVTCSLSTPFSMATFVVSPKR